MKKSLVIAFIFAGIFGTAAAQSAVYQLHTNQAQEELPLLNNGFFYTLPKTAFQVNVVVTRTNEIKGYFSEYADKLLGLNNVTTSNRTLYKLKSVSITPISLPDTNAIFYAELSPKQLKNGFLNQILQQKTEQKPTIFNEKFQPTTTQLPDFFKNYSVLTYKEEEDSYVETQIVDGVVTEVPVNRTKKVTKSVEEKAQEAADFIIKIRNDRYDLTAAAQEVPYSKEAFEFLVNELNKWEKNYLDLFTGIAVEDDLSYTFVVVPKSSEEETIPLFSVNPQTGFSRTIAQKGTENYSLKCSPLMSYEKKNQFMGTISKHEKYRSKNGYCIRRAAPAQVVLLHNNVEILPFGIFSIAQFGEIETLPSHCNDFDISAFAIFF